MNVLTLISFILYRQLKISNVNCLDETKIPVHTILYLSLYYLVNDLVHLPNPTINILTSTLACPLQSNTCWKIKSCNHLKFIFINLTKQTNY